MKLSDLALGEPDEGDPEDVSASDDMLFEEAASEAFDLFSKGKKAEASAALKSAIEVCVAEYMADDGEET